MKKSPLLPFRVVNDNDLSASFTTNPTDARYQDNIMYQIVIASGGNAVGVLDVEVSSDYDPKQINAGNWTDLGSAYQATIDGVGTGLIMLNQFEAVWMRLKYTRTSGTSTMNAYVSGKQV